MEKNKSVKRMDWRQKVLISILGSFIVILSILFYITYHYFVAKIETGNEKVVLMTFEQAEKNLKNVLKNAELCLDKYVTNDLIWDFENNYPETDIESNELKVKITDSFINEMSVNREVSALGFLRGDGWGIVSSVLRKNRTGNTQISGNLLKVLKQSKDAYPYTTWIPSWELNLNNESPLRLMSQNASLIGIKALGESSELEKDGYLIVAVSESDLQSTYRSVAFDDSTAVLVDGNNQIISNVGEKLLGEQLKTGSDTQNIEYDLDIYNWKLCDMIPKQEYMKDAKDIRNFGVLICLAAILSTAFVSIVWSRKYTRPIELLMKNMHHVRYQEFEIDKPQKLGWKELDRLNEELYYTAQSIKRIEDGTSMDLSDANPTIRMCLEITPKNITRIDSNCIELTENALPGLVQAESDEAFQSAKEALLQQLADAGVEESIEWWQNAWETSKSSIDKLESK